MPQGFLQPFLHFAEAFLQQGLVQPSLHFADAFLQQGLVQPSLHFAEAFLLQPFLQPAFFVAHGPPRPIAQIQPKLAVVSATAQTHVKINRTIVLRAFFIVQS